jgi:hypothetical protein
VSFDASLTVQREHALTTAGGDGRAETVASAECPNLSPAVQELATIVNTRDTNYHCLGVGIDAGANITKVLFVTHVGGSDPASVRQVANIRIREYTPAEIKRDQEVVLDASPGMTP